MEFVVPILMSFWKHILLFQMTVHKNKVIFVIQLFYYKIKIQIFLPLQKQVIYSTETYSTNEYFLF